MSVAFTFNSLKPTQLHAALNQQPSQLVNGFSSPHLVLFPADAAEALAERQVVPHRVPPPSRRGPVVGKRVDDPLVDAFDGELLLRRLLDGHEDQAAEGVRGLAGGRGG